MAWRTLNVSFILALLVLTALVWTVLSFYLEPVISRDGVVYLGIVQEWHEHGNGQYIEQWPFIPPLALYLMKLLMDCGLSAVAAGIGINIVLRSLLPVITYLTTQEVLGDKRIAIAAALLITFNPSLNDLAIEPQRDIIYLFFCGIMIWLLLAAIIRKKWYFAAAAGAFLSPALLARHEAFEMLLIAGLGLVILIIKNYRDWKRHLGNAAAFLAAFVLTSYLLLSMMGVLELVPRYCVSYQSRVMLMEQKLYNPGEPDND